MKKLSKIILGLIVILSTTTILTGCGQAEEEEPEEKIQRASEPKEVQVANLKQTNYEIYFTKTAEVSAQNTINVVPEVSGRISKIKFEVGDYVKKNDLLVELGDSLSSEITDLQIDSAETSLEISKQNQNLTNKSANNNSQLTEIAVDTAYLNYNNALQAKRNAENTFVDQYDSAKIEVDNAKIGEKNAKNTYQDAQDLLEDLEDDLDDLQDDIDDLEDDIDDLEDDDKNNPQITILEEQLKGLEEAEKQLKKSIDSTESQLEATKNNLGLAQNRVDQADLTLEQLKNGYQTQEDQLDFAIDAAYNQYLQAIEQYEGSEIGKELQNLGAESQINQVESNLKSLKLNKEKENILSPTEGRITAINFDEGNLVNPGQVLITIESDEKLVLKTSLNSDEIKLIDESEDVEIGENGLKGKIIYVSPNVDPQSKKYNLEIEIDKPKENSEEKIQSQELVKIKFPINQKNRIFIPLNAVSLNNNKQIVKLKNEENKVEYQEVKMGEVVGNLVEIVEGLDGDENLILTVETFLEEGESVQLKSIPR